MKINDILLKEVKIYSIEKNNKKISIKNTRNYGIDLARIISMIFIIGHHIIFHGGPLFQIEKFTYKHQVHIFLNIIFCSGVNIFGMISGFVGFHTHKYSNLFYLLITTFFYNILIALIFNFFDSSLIKDIKYFLYPIFITDYWYFDCYFLMYFFLPIINQGINGMDLKSMKNCILILFLIFSCLGEIKNYTQRFASKDILKINNGFSTYWLLILYFYGSYFGKFHKNKKSNFLYYIKFIIILIMAALIRTKIIIYKMGKNNINMSRIVDYAAPSEVLISYSFIMIFSNYNINNKIILKLIKIFAPLTYGVYLIHNHFLVRKYIISKYFQWLLKLEKSGLIFLAEFLCCFGIFIFCSLIDYMRILLFKLLKIKDILFSVQNIIEKISNISYPFIYL